MITNNIYGQLDHIAITVKIMTIVHTIALTNSVGIFLNKLPPLKSLGIVPSSSSAVSV